MVLSGSSYGHVVCGFDNMLWCLGMIGNSLKQLAVSVRIRSIYAVEYIYLYQLHRVGGSASIRIDGYKEWWVDNKLHNQYGPSCIHINGYKEWWIGGALVREGLAW